MSGFEQFFFHLFGLVALASALLFVTRKSPVAAALWLVSTMFSLAALYILMNAQFVGAVQVLVYAGAIMVVFLFVVMLLNLGQVNPAADFKSLPARIAGGLVALALFAELLVVGRVQLPLDLGPGAGTTAVVDGDENVIAPVAGALFTQHLVAFEVTSLLLLAAVVGAVVLAKPRRSES
ncbi:NADH dehydrogenase [Gemmatimonadetes bacterium T265]|nr:NADH dehydrogenase [Gemmatimonadetes bacterium T265]